VRFTEASITEIPEATKPEPGRDAGVEF